MLVYSLSFHADYRCRHSGVCCTADWDVPVELPIYRGLDDALRSRRLQAAAPADGDGPPLIVADDMPEGAAAMLARTTAGDCVFYHRGSGLCVVHRDLGEPHLPSTCRHFPRLAVRDGRGTFITLSHYCPTAAGMLFRDDGPIAVVEGPPAFPPAEYEGLVVGEDDWPPLLRPRMLMDLDGYSAWERHMVARCAGHGIDPESVVATLERDARRLGAFTPGQGSLVEAVSALPAAIVSAHAPRSIEESLVLQREVAAAVPEDMRPDGDEAGLGEMYAAAVLPAWREFAEPLKRYLAGKAFASWTAYQGRGVRTIVRGLEAALAVVRVEAARRCRDAGRGLDQALLAEAFRQADFALNHLAVGEDLADAWSRVEDGGP